MIEKRLILRWVLLFSIGLVIYYNASHALRGARPPVVAGVYAWLLAVATFGFVWFAVQKSFWDPELGPTKLPPHVIQYDRSPVAGMHVSTDSSATLAVADPRAVGVIYWAAEPAPTMTLYANREKPDAAFENLTNGGVARVVNRSATLTFRCPRRLKVMGMALPKHVNYRVVFNTGKISGVRSFEVSC